MAHVGLLRGIKIDSCLLLNILGIFLCVPFLALYVAFCVHHDFCHGSSKPFGEGFIKMPNHLSIMEGSYEHILIGVDDLDGRLIESGELVPQGF